MDDGTDAPPIVGAEVGSVVVVEDSAERPLKGLRIFGRTTQDGTPTPEAPVPLESVGESVTVTVCGKNLLQKTEYTTTKAANIITESENFPTLIPGIYTISFECQAGEMKYMTVAFKNNGVAVETATINPNAKTVYTFSLPSPINQAVWYVREAVVITNAQLEIGSAATAYEPYKETKATVSALNGLPGIPVTSDGNYTDESGQQWVCDEVDFEKGVYVQRVNSLRVTEDTEISSLSILGSCIRIGIPLGGKDTSSSKKAFSTHLTWLADYSSDTPHFYCDTYAWIFLPESCGSTKEELRTWLAENQFAILYRMNKQEEIPLSAEELTQYAALHTNYPNTTVYNDQGAGMEVKYVADTKLYIDKKFSELSVALLNN